MCPILHTTTESRHSDVEESVIENLINRTLEAKRNYDEIQKKPYDQSVYTALQESTANLIKSLKEIGVNFK